MDPTVADSTREKSLVSPVTPANEGPAPRSPRPRRSRRLLGVLALLGTAVVLGLVWSNWRTQPAADTLEGELFVGVGWPVVGKDMLLVDEAGALPVRVGQWMSLQARL